MAVPVRSAGLVQDAVARYMEAGGLRRHTARMRKEYRARRAAFIDLFPEGVPMEGGLHAVVPLRADADEDRVVARCRARGLGVTGMADYWSARRPRTPGIVLGLVGSGIVAVLFAFLYNSASAHQEILEGVVALVAMGMLLFTSNWMLSKSSVESWNRYIKDRTEASISDGGFWALASLSFLAVFREGAETVMFYEALFTMDPGGKASIWQGFAVGVVLLVAIFLLIRFTSVKIPLRPFFAVTSFLMAVLVVIFAGGGVHALIEGDILPASYLPGWPTYDYLGLYPYRATLIAQVVMAVVVVTLLVVSTVRRRREDRAKAVVEAAEETEEAKTVATRTNEKEDGGAAASAPSAGSADDAPSEDDGTASADEPSSDSASSSSSSSDEEK